MSDDSNIKKTRTKRVATRKVTSLSNDELLDKIISKSKVKKEKQKNYTVRTKHTNTFQRSIRPNKKIISNDGEELLDKIIAKNKEKKLNKTKKLPVVDLPKLKEETKAENVQQIKEEQPKEVVQEIKEEEPKKENVQEQQLPVEESEEDLIITKQIVIDVDKLDVKDREVIEKIRRAVEEEQEKDETFIDKSSPIEVEVPKDEPLVFKPEKKKTNLLQFFYLIPVFILGVSIGILLVHCLNNNTANISEYKIADDMDEFKQIEEQEKQEEQERLALLYDECMSRPYDERDNNETLQTYKAELDNYLVKYKTSVMMKDITTGYIYSYNPTKVYYAASTAKTLAALYLYSKAMVGEVNLDETLTYSSRFNWSDSLEMSKHRYGEKISLRELIKYAITVSDNSAYQMLVNYIGRQNLKNYGRSLGAKYTLNGSDNFGSISVEDAIIYTSTLNNLIETGGELGQELKQIFLIALQNDLAIPEYGILAAHKYGEYKPNYHDIGIVYAEKPYLVAVLTTEGYGDFEGKVKDISKHLYRLHSIFWENRKGICATEVYQ